MGSCGLDALAQDRDQWWALVNMVITFGFHKRRGIIYQAE